MRKFKMIFAALAVSVASMVAFAGCGAPSTLEAYLEKNPSEQEQLDNVADAFGDGVDIDVKGNEMIYTVDTGMTLTDEEKEAVKPQIEAAFEQSEPQIKEMVGTIEEQTGLKEISIRIIYTDSEGNEIYHYTFDDEAE